MEIIKTITKIREQLDKNRAEGCTIGLVPTMGAFHKGHEALMEKAKKENDIVVVSLFVNPTQFSEGEDFESYPADIDSDSEIAEQASIDYLFVPSSDQIYGDDHDTYVDVGRLGQVLCGKTRTTHFRGVATVVLKLFNIVEPGIAYFGKKDYQQVRVIEKMVNDLDVQVKIETIPIVRDEDGIATSSRNTYLTYDEREQATVLYQAISKAKELAQNGVDSVSELETVAGEMIDKRPLVQLEYIHIVDSQALENLKTVSKGKSLAAIAARVGKARLIDNIEI